MVTSPNFHSTFVDLDSKGSKFGAVGADITAICCANRDCREVTLNLVFGKAAVANHRNIVVAAGSEKWKLRPASFRKPQPASVPKVLADDYYEACAIRDLSPKASATLSRRCIQGMIRDFCGITKNRLIDEIVALEKLSDEGSAPKGVEPETVDAIDHVRKIGNIGAHMEKDINVIVDVDPGEAEALTDLIELLFDEWYVARDKREAKLKKIQQISTLKEEAKKKPRA